MNGSRDNRNPVLGSVAQRYLPDSLAVFCADSVEQRLSKVISHFLGKGRPELHMRAMPDKVFFHLQLRIIYIGFHPIGGGS